MVMQTPRILFTIRRVKNEPVRSEAIGGDVLWCYKMEDKMKVGISINNQNIRISKMTQIT
jgi:hypothetical protein